MSTLNFLEIAGKLQSTTFIEMDKLENLVLNVQCCGNHG